MSDTYNKVSEVDGQVADAEAPKETCCGCFELGLGLKLLGAFMILSVPVDCFEFVKIFKYSEFFEENYQFYLYLVCTFIKIVIAGFCAFLYIKFFKQDSLETRQGLEKSFKAQMVYIAFQGFQFFFFVNY
jgi:hypothetical protein